MSAPNLAATGAATQPADDGLAARLDAWPQGARSPLVPACGARLAALVERFRLDPFEADLMKLAAADAIDPELHALIGEASTVGPTLALAAALFAGARPRALAPSRPLRRWGLVEPTAAAGDPRAPFVLGDGARRYLVEDDEVEPTLAVLMRASADDPVLADSHGALVGAIAARLGGTGLVVLTGGHAGDRAAVAAAGVTAAGLEPLALAADALPASPQDLAGTARRLERELVLHGRVAVLDADAAPPATVTRLAEELRAPLIAAGAAAPPGLRRAHSQLRLEPLDFATRRRLWRENLGEAAPEPDELDRLAWQFRFGGREIRELATGAAAGAEPALWAACRAALRDDDHGLARRVQARARLADVVLPAGAMRRLEAITAQGRRQARVHHDWGFAARGSRGLGITALFTGPSGTGKTFAAEAIAGELGLDLLRVELSQLVSKYIGETEKNLDAVFAQADRGGAVLLFDEADALFGKRSEVKDSHDRYANIEVSYLLQRMEAYRGLAILTTNLKTALDEAFLRRLRSVVHFPFPDPSLRAELWHRAFPPETPRDALDWERLARLHLTGANIDTVAMNAAFLAAAEGAAVGMRHVAEAAESEYVKLERTVAAARTLEEGR